MRSTILLLALLAACSTPTGSPAITPPPPGIDPTVKATNTAPLPLVLRWWSQSGLVAVDSIASGAVKCVHFLSAAPTDSVRFYAFMGDSTNPTVGYAATWSPWFDPKTGLLSGVDSATAAREYPYGAENWLLTGSGTAASFHVTMLPVQLPPCL